MEAVPNMAVPSSPTMVGVVALINRSHNSTVRSMVVVISSSMVVISIGMLDHLSNTTSHLSSTTSHLISHNTNQSTKMRLITTHHLHHLIIRMMIMINISREVIQASSSRGIQFSLPSNLVRHRPTSHQPNEMLICKLNKFYRDTFKK